METALDELVRSRAGGRCEFCRFPEAFAELPFQLDHIIARQHGGRSEPANLALVCCFCNRHEDSWEDHFAWDGAVLNGRTAIGRATIRTLAINRSDAVAVRQWLIASGLFFT